MPLKLDWTIKVSDILTSVTLIVSVVALLHSLEQDRDAKITEQAGRIRAAAAIGISKLDRWQALQLSMYQELQPGFIELSEQMMKRYDVQRVRDELWKKVNATRTLISQKVLDEQLGTAYSDLLSHFPAARSKFTEAFAKLSAIESSTTEDFLGASEDRILALEGQQKDYTTPTLGNALRESASTYSVQLKTRSEAVIFPVREYLFGVISQPDSAIVAASKKGVTR
jgi:hypothetical protein